jgi:mannose-6-phosphate isomerase-like protein (cupin superfamily)
MNSDSLNRRDVMRLPAITMAGTVLLPDMTLATKPKIKRKAVFIRAGEGKKAKMGDNDIIFKLDKSQTSGNLGSSEITLKSGYLDSIPHFHKTFDEVCIVLEGTVTIKVVDEIYTVGAGGWHLRPRESVHCFWNSGTVDARFIELYIPAGHEQFMQELTNLFINGKIPTHQQVTQLGERFDTHFQWDQLPEVLNKYKVHL